MDLLRLNQTQDNKKNTPPLIKYSGDFNQQLITGVELPDSIKTFFFGIDEEIQLSQLELRDVEYGFTLIETIITLADLYLKTENEEEGKFLEKKIVKYNTKYKFLVRAKRGVEGFTMKVLNTFFQNVQQEITDKTKRGKLEELKNKLGVMS